MADFITACANLSDLTTWYTTTVPGTIPSGDRYIAELAAGNYDLNGVTWTGKTLASAGQLIIRPQSGARKNGSGSPARFDSSGAVLRTTFNAVNSFGSNVVGGFVFEDAQFSLYQVGSITFGNGSQVRRCVSQVSHTSGTISFNGTGQAIDTIFVTTVNAAAVAFNGASAQDGNTIVTFIDRAAMGLNGSFQNATWKNCVALNLAASPTVDPWPAPPTSFFSATSSNNGTSNAASGNMPNGGGGGVVNIAPGTAFANVTSSTTLDLQPKAGSAVLNAGVVSSTNGGIDWYGSARSGSTPTIGAVETVYAPPSAALAGAGGGKAGGAGTMSAGGAGLGGAGGAQAGGAGTFAGSGAQLAGSGGAKAGGGANLSQPTGTLTVGPFKNNGGVVQASLTGLEALIIRLADWAAIKTLHGQATDAGGYMTLVDTSIITGQDYAVATRGAIGTPTPMGIEKYTAT